LGREDVEEDVGSYRTVLRKRKKMVEFWKTKH